MAVIANPGLFDLKLVLLTSLHKQSEDDSLVAVQCRLSPCAGSGAQWDHGILLDLPGCQCEAHGDTSWVEAPED